VHASKRILKIGEYVAEIWKMTKLDVFWGTVSNLPRHRLRGIKKLHRHPRCLRVCLS